MFKLRPYQTDMVRRNEECWASGIKNPVSVLPTGAGKTVIASEIIRREQERDGYFAAIAHRQELVSQISLALARQGVMHDVVAPRAVRRFCGDLHNTELGRCFVSTKANGFVGGVDTIVRRDLGRLKDRVSLMFQDECFPARTLITMHDGSTKPIEDVQVGDRVIAYDEDADRLIDQRVDRLFKNPAPREMVAVGITTHHVLICTKGHPFYTRRGWVPAAELTTNDEVLYDHMDLHPVQPGYLQHQRGAALPLAEDWQNILRQGLRQKVRQGKPQTPKTGTSTGSTMHPVRAGSRLNVLAVYPLEGNRTRVLQSQVCKYLPVSGFQSHGGGNEPEIRFKEDAGKKPYAQSCVPRENVPNLTIDWTPTYREGWERARSNSSRKSINDLAGALRVPLTGCGSDFSVQPTLSDAGTLQDRLCERAIEDSDRSGWPLSPSVCASRARPTQRRGFKFTRLESVSIFEQDDTRAPGGGFVYNIEVRGLHTYVADGVVVHNCHHVLADNKWGKAAAMFPHANGLFVTATPCRADGKGLGRHADGLFDTILEGPTMREIIRMGSLTDYKIYAPPSNIDLTNVAISRATGDYNQTQLQDESKRQRRGIVGNVVRNYIDYTPNTQCVAFVVDVATAMQTAEEFNAQGIPAVALSANNTDAERHEAITKFKNGEIKVIVNVDLLGEGFDCPAIESVIMARPTMSYGLYCLSLDTEVLTPNGWVTYDQLDSVDSVYAWDQETEEISIQPATDKVLREKYHDEVMYGVQGPHLDILVSDKHDMLVRGRAGTSKKWRKQEAWEVAARKSMFKIPVSGEFKSKGSGLTKSELHFLGWFLSDGTLNKRTRSISIGQSSNKPKHIDSIEKSIQGCGFKYGKHVCKRYGEYEKYADAVVFTVSFGKPRGRDKHLTGWSRLEKWIDKSLPDCYDLLTREELLTLLETWNLGDGINNHSSLDYTKRTLTITMGDNKHMGDRLQQLCVTRGLRCNMGVQKNPAPKKDLYVLHIRDTKTATIAGTNVSDGSISGKKQYKRSRFEVKSDPHDSVWCLTNPKGTLITRRNGKVAIVGNCQQFGRSLRLLEGKKFGIVVDMVGNVKRHGLPDAPRQWSLDRSERKGGGADDTRPIKVCPECTGAYEVGPTRCPYCGYAAVVAPGEAGGGLVEVDAGLRELTAEELAEMRGEIDKLGREWHTAPGMSKQQYIQFSQHNKTVRSQKRLRDAIAYYAGACKSVGMDDRGIHIQFTTLYGTSITEAQTLRPKDADALSDRIESDLVAMGVDRVAG